MGKGGASAEDALPSFDPAFSLRKKSTGGLRRSLCIHQFIEK
jgi:hypothetical protein